MQEFVSKVTTRDGRLKENAKYKGHYIHSLRRVVVIDSLNEPMTFSPYVFHNGFKKDDKK